MESKLYEECHEGGGFMAEQAMLKQDETVRTQIPTMKTLGGSDAPKKAEKAAPEAAVKAPEPIDFSKVKIEPLFEEHPELGLRTALQEHVPMRALRFEGLLVVRGRNVAQFAFGAAAAFPRRGRLSLDGHRHAELVAVRALVDDPLALDEGHAFVGLQ